MVASRAVLGALLSALAVGLAACASPASPSGMQLAAGSAAAAHQGEPSWRALRIGEIRGGSDTDPLWLSHISNAAFRTALETSLGGLDFLAAGGAGAGYVVDARIVDVQLPVGAKDPVLIIAPVEWEVTVKVRYTVTPAAGGAPVFDDVVAATGSGAPAFSASTRVRNAAEAAVRANLESFVQRLRTEWRGPTAR